MKSKIKRGINYKLSPSILYIQDFQKIIGILKDAFPDSLISIETDENEYDNLEEFLNDERGKTKTDVRLELKNKGNRIRINLTRYPRFESYVYNNESLIEGIYFKVKKMLEKNNPYFIIKKDPYTLLAVIALSGITGVTFISGVQSKSLYYILLSMISGLSCVLIFWGHFNLPEISIIIDSRENRPSFFRRNKDKLFIAVISATLSALFTLVLTLIIKNR